MTPDPHWRRDAKIITATGERPVRNSEPGSTAAPGTEAKTDSEFIELDFKPALKRLLGEEPGLAIQSDLKTVLKLLGGTKMDMAKAAIIHQAIAETYRETLRGALGDGFTWQTPRYPVPKGGDPT